MLDRALPEHTALVELPGAPIFGHLLLEKVADDALTDRRSAVALLLLSCLLTDLSAQIQRLTQTVAHNSLRPDLADGFLVQLVPDALGSPVYAHVHRPEPTVACAVAQKLALVGRAEEHAAARQLLDVSAVGSAETVAALREELLDPADLGLVECLQLAHLDQPHALNDLARLLALERPQTVVEVAAAHHVQQR